jgi:hypothetical protein
MLASAGFGYYAFFAHALCEKYLTYGIVDLMCAGMAQIFAL